MSGTSVEKPSTVWQAPLVRHLIVALTLAILIFAIYAGSTENGFVWDDHEQILRNPALLNPSPWTQLFTSGVWAFQHPGEHGRDNQYRPMQMLAYRVVGQLGGFQAGYFHWVSLLLHFAASLLFYGIVCRLTNRFSVAAAAACLFAAHPIQTETVSWISAQSDAGCAVFVFLAFLLYLRGTRISWAASYACFGVALLWKEMAVTLPILVAAHILLCRREKRLLKRTLPYWGVFAAYLVLRFRALGVLYAPQRDWLLSPLQYALTDLQLLATYWWKLAWPLPLMGYHVFAPVLSAGNLKVLAVLILLALAAGSVYRLHTDPLAVFCAAWVCIALVPALNLQAVGRNVFAERYLYIPSAGFCLLAVWLAAETLTLLPANYRKWTGGIVTALVVIFFADQAAARSAAWKDNMTFFSESLAQSPNSAFLHNMVAELLRTERGDPTDAAAHYTQAIALAQKWNPPENLEISIASVGLARILADSGDFNRALQSLELAQQADPLNNEALVARGSILTQAGRWSEARKALEEVLAKNRDDEIALKSLGIVAWQGEHAYPQAIEYFERALRLPASDITRSSIHSNLGSVYCEMERCREGIPHLEQAIRLDPTDPQYHTNLGTALRLTGHPAEAKAQFLLALKIAPGFEPAKASLERLAREEGR